MFPSFTHRTVSPCEIEIESGAKNPTHGFALPSQPAMSPTETKCVVAAIVVLVVAGTVVVVVELVVEEVVVDDGWVVVVGALVGVDVGGLLVEVVVAEPTVVELAAEVEAVGAPDELVVVPAVGAVRVEADEVAVGLGGTAKSADESDAHEAATSANARIRMPTIFRETGMRIHLSPRSNRSETCTEAAVKWFTASTSRNYPRGSSVLLDRESRRVGVACS